MSKYVKGAESLAAKLKGLNEYLHKNVLPEVCKEGAQTMAYEIVSRMPEDTGKLKKSVKASAGRRYKQVRKAQCRIRNPAALPQEFGNKHLKANPSIKPAFQSRKKQVATFVKGEIVAAIKAYGRMK